MRCTKSISLKNPSQELGVQLVKQAAVKTGEKASDGTTTSTLLAREMVKEGLQAVANGENAVKIKRKIDESVQKVVVNLKTKISEDISGEEQLEQIATISSNNDTETGKMIATAIDKVGLEGVVHVEESRTGDIMYKILTYIYLEHITPILILNSVCRQPFPNANADTNPHPNPNRSVNPQ